MATKRTALTAAGLSADRPNVDLSDPPFMSPADCPECRGSGYIYPKSERVLTLAELLRGQTKCSACDGTGESP